jgi:hypothetical protein
MITNHSAESFFKSRVKASYPHLWNRIAAAGAIFAIVFVGMASPATAQNIPAVVTVHSLVQAPNPVPFWV